MLLLNVIKAESLVDAMTRLVWWHIKLLLLPTRAYWCFFRFRGGCRDFLWQLNLGGVALGYSHGDGWQQGL